MTPERWHQITELFHEARRREPAERIAWVLKTCGDDDELRLEVTRMLAGDTLHGPLGDHAPLLSLAHLESGYMIGPYRIDRLIGAGGMGEVYRASDTHLGRDVAIKVLPDLFADDTHRLQRFEHEARVLAALNHPNIASIYGVEHTKAIRSLVMEYVDGRTLAESLAEHPFSISDALAVARDVADALVAAHAEGIIHCDLKPANVKVTERGYVKVLDFGLARAIGRLDSAVDNVQGQIAGTPGYMSPEQLSGDEIDVRTDVWAFGCLLYELLTGCPVVNERTGPDGTATVISDEPDLQKLPRRTPSRIRRLIRDCLVNDRDHRLQTMAEARYVIVSSLHQRSRSESMAWIAATLALVSATYLLWKLAHQSTNLAAPRFTRITTDSGLTADPTLSADGEFVAYASDRASNNLDVWIQPTTGGTPTRLTDGGTDNSEPSLSPDGTRIVFRSEHDRGGIYVVPSNGGRSILLAPLGRNPRFSPDGRWIAYWVGDQSWYGRRRIYVIPAEGGQPRPIQAGFFFATNPVWSPDGQHLLFRGARDANAAQHGRFDWWVTALDGSNAIATGANQLQVEGSLPATHSDQMHGGWGVDPSDWIGKAVFFSAASGNAGLNASLWRVELSDAYHVRSASRLTAGTENVVQPSAVGSRVAFASLAETVNVWSLALDPRTGRPSGEPQRVTSSAAVDTLPVPSADGRYVAFASNRTGSLHVWLKDLQTGAERAPTASSDVELPWLLSQDGGRLLSCAVGPDPQTSLGCFLTHVADGSRRDICRDCPSASIQDWFDHGRKILYKKAISTNTQLVLRDLDSLRDTLFLDHTGESITAARFSHDEHWITFQIVIDAATRRQIYVAPVREGIAANESEWIPITDGGGLDRNATWSADDDKLYFLSERDGFRCIWMQRLDGVRKRPAGEPIAIYHFHQTRRSLMPFQEMVAIGLSATRDRLIFSVTETNGNIWLAKFDQSVH